MIYADNAATTKITEEVFNAMKPYLTEYYGNPSSLYNFSYECANAVTRAREQVAKAINAEPTEIYFTSCGSEADNWAIRGVCHGDMKKHIITSDFEHPAVLNTCRYMERMGYVVSYVKPDKWGYISPTKIDKFIKDDTKLVSIMFANNEIGTIQNIKAIGEICHKHNVLFHTDAVQAVGHTPIDVKAMNIDMLSMSGHKFHAPKGIGVLYVRKGVDIEPLIYGGHQEFGMRAGTENVANIVGIGKAIEIATQNLPQQEKVCDKRRELMRNLLTIKGVGVNGGVDNRIAGNLNISVEGIEAETLVLMLDMEGICASAGSACCSGSLEPSRTLKAIGLDDHTAFQSIRISLGDDVTWDDVVAIYSAIKRIIERTRKNNDISV